MPYDLSFILPKFQKLHKKTVSSFQQQLITMLLVEK